MLRPGEGPAANLRQSTSTELGNGGLSTPARSPVPGSEGQAAFPSPCPGLQEGYHLLLLWAQLRKKEGAGRKPLSPLLNSRVAASWGGVGLGRGRPEKDGRQWHV